MLLRLRRLVKQRRGERLEQSSRRRLTIELLMKRISAVFRGSSSIHGPAAYLGMWPIYFNSRLPIYHSYNRLCY
ncbi:hypothetical protein ACEPAI_9631 [Sanghuangporus weigelae]